jgi:hypothetical protein
MGCSQSGCHSPCCEQGEPPVLWSAAGRLAPNVVPLVFLAAGMNWVYSGWNLGLANTILHAGSNESCQVLVKAGYNNVTCVWSHR